MPHDAVPEWHDPHDWREGRRLRAWALYQQGWKQRTIADALGVSPGAVSQWLKRAREGGRAALRRCPAPGRPPKLTVAQRAAVPALLARGAEAFGFTGQVWTTKRIAAVLEVAFGVRHHPAHISRVVRACGWSVQLPIRRASQRDEGAIERWYAERWPALKREADQEGRTIVWLDEAGFYLLPSRIRTYAPRGQTPVLRVPLTRDHLSVISAITPAGKLFVQVGEQALRGPDVVRFLHHLLGHLPGKLLVIWDRSQIHRGRRVQAFLAAGAAARLRLEYLPAYAPETNPDEGVWNLLKRVELANRCCRDLHHLRAELRRAVLRLRQKPHLVRACIGHAGYHL
jgi:transposase